MFYKCNLHTHTQFCDGKCSMEDMVLEAIGKGFDTLGFSPHSFTSFDVSYCMTDFDAYVCEFLRLKDKYGDKINLLCGLELDAFGQLPSEKPDYIIGSVHYLKTKAGMFAIDESQDVFDKMLCDGFGGDKKALAQCYFDTVVQMVLDKKPDVIGHFDLISLYGDFSDVQDDYDKIAQQAIQKIIGCDAVVEINSRRKFKGKGGLYPSDKLVCEFEKLGFDFVLSSDAHNTSALGFEFDDTLQWLKSLGVQQVVCFDKDMQKNYINL